MTRAASRPSGDRDPVIGALQQVARGLRPPLFYSPYEAAVWSVLSARRPAAQMARLRAALSEAHGVVFDLAGERLAALPTPTQLLAVDEFPGIDPTRLSRTARDRPRGRRRAAGGRTGCCGSDRTPRWPTCSN